MTLRNKNLHLHSSKNLVHHQHPSGGARMHWVEVEKKEEMISPIMTLIELSTFMLIYNCRTAYDLLK